MAATLPAVVDADYEGDFKIRLKRASRLTAFSQYC